MKPSSIYSFVSELACPECSGFGLSFAATLQCADCGALCSLVDDVLCLNPGQVDDDTVSGEFTVFRAALRAGVPWAESLRLYIANSQDPAAVLETLFCNGESAWLYHMHLRHNMVGLDLSYGFSSAAGGLARHVGFVYALNANLEACLFNQQCNHYDTQTGNVLQVHRLDVGYLPFKDHSLDFVTLSCPIHLLASGKRQQSQLLAEVRRVLKLQGQFYCQFENRLAYNRLLSLVPGLGAGRSSGESGYRTTPGAFKRMLQHSDLHCGEVLQLHAQSSGQLKELSFPASETAHGDGKSLKDRIKHSTLFFPKYGIISNVGDDISSGSIRVAVNSIARSLNINSNDIAICYEKIFSRDKIIAQMSLGDDVAYLRIPMSESARHAERTNHLLCKQLQSEGKITLSFPVPMVVQRDHAFEFYVESHVPGESALQEIKTADADSHLSNVVEALQQLNPELTSMVCLDTKLYADSVQDVLDQLPSLIDQKTFQRVSDFFRESILNTDVLCGLMHGDFGVNNLRLTSAGEVCGLIDWEYGKLHGLCSLDAINYMVSYYSARYADKTFAECIYALAQGDTMAPELDRFWSLYCGAFGLSVDSLPKLAYIWWLHVLDCRLKGVLKYSDIEIGRFLISVTDLLFASPVVHLR